MDRKQRHGWRAAVGSSLLIVALAAAPAWPLGAATKTEKAAEYLEEAQTFYRKGDFDAAVIQLKNALQQEPDNVAARQLLGEIYVRLGQGASAEKELKVARDRGLDESKVVVALARAYLLQGKHQAILDEFPAGGRESSIEGEIAVLRGYAHLGLKQLDPGEAEFRRATTLMGGDIRPGIGLAETLYYKNKFDEAESLVDQAIATDNTVAEAFLLKGDLRRIRGDIDGSVANFGRAVDLQPSNVRARMGRAAGLVQQNKDDAARKDIQAVRDLSPRHPLAAYLTAVILAKNKDYKKAQETLEATGDFVKAHPPSRLLLGAVHYYQGGSNLEQARSNLSEFVKAVPGHVAGRKLYGATLIRLKDFAGAVDTLRLAEKMAPDDAQLLGLIGTALMQMRKFDESTRYFERAADIEPENVGFKTQIAIGQIGTGELDQAVEHLESALESDPKESRAGVILALTHLRQREFDKAIQVTGDLAKRMADNPLPYNLQGIAYLGKNQVDQAKASFQQALKIKSDYSAARLYLARIALAAKDSKAAESEYRTILKTDKANVPAMVGLSEISRAANKTDDAIDWLKRAADANPSATAPRLRLVDLLIAAKRPDQALVAARELEAAGATNPSVIDAIGRAHLASAQLQRGKGQERLASDASANAVNSYRKLVEQVPNSAEAYFRLGLAQIAVKDENGARTNLNRALDIDVEHQASRAALIDLELRTQQPDKALAVANSYRERRPDLAAADVLVGDILMRTERYKDAAAAYEKAKAKQNSAVVANRLFQARSKSGDAVGAIKPLEEWVAANPDDKATRLVMATAYLQVGQNDRALEQHEKLFADAPENPLLLNNLAWLYFQKGDKRAKEFASKAYGLAPDSGAVTDTYGWILLKEGDVKQGLEKLQKASSQDPENGEIRYHMIVALKQSGRRDEARRALEDLLKSGREFDSMKEARTLLRELSGG